MLEHILTPEFAIFGGILACGFAILTLVLAGRSAFTSGLANRLVTLKAQIEDRRKTLQDMGNKLAETELLQSRADHLEKRTNALQQDLKPLEEKHLKAVSEYEDVKGKLRQAREEWATMTDKVETYKSRISQIDNLEQDIKKLTESRQQLEEAVKTLPDRQRELERINQSIEQKSSELAAVDKDLKNLNQELINVKEQFQQAFDKKSKAEEDLKQRQDELVRLEQDIKELTDGYRQLEEAVKPLSDRQRELERVNQSIEQRSSELAATDKNLKNLSQELINTKEKIQQANDRLSKADEDLKRRKEGLARLESAKIDLSARVETLSEKLKSVGRMPPEAFDSLKLPVFENSKNVRADVDEQTALDALNSLVEYCGFEIPRRLQDAFHTALKTSDISCLTVMAGVSGTGKSAFPKLYSEAMGMYFLPLAVEPRWDSPQDLFGFLNYMENRFEATTLGRSLVQFNNSPHVSQNGSSMRDRILLVLLDEMNLARIEYYFSEFLSKLEMRRNANLDRKEDYQMVSVEIFAGHAAGEGVEASPPVRLYAGSNVLFVGTMNEDESTQSLSDKVIDRANVLYFGRPNKLHDKRQQLSGNSDWMALRADVWQSWIVDPSNTSIPGYDQVDSIINNVNQSLALLGRPFGWRTYKAIKAYVANHPSVRYREDSGLLPLSDQIAMRVMPKLRGLDLNEHGEVFNSLGQTLRKINDPALQQAFDKANQSTQGYFDWRGINWG